MVYGSKISYKHASFIFNEHGHVISRGYNHQKGYFNPQFSIHAEVDVINNIKYDKKHKDKFHLYTILVVRLGTINYIDDDTTIINLSESAPCKNCYNYIIDNGFKEKNIYHSTIITEKQYKYDFHYNKN